MAEAVEYNSRKDKMKSFSCIPKEYLFLGIVLILIAFVSISELAKPEFPTPNRESSPQQVRTLKKQEKKENNVTVSLEYLPEKSDSSKTVFAITLDTHSENLDAFDFQKDIFLGKDGRGILPVVVSQSGSGHHRKAEVTFKRTVPPLTIVLSNLAGISRREFQFLNL